MSTESPSLWIISDFKRPRGWFSQMIDFSQWYSNINKPGYDSTSRNAVLKLAIEEIKQNIKEDARFQSDNQRRAELARRIDVGGGEWTPLHYAGWWGDVHMAETLLDCGADINQSDSNGNTPLHWFTREPRGLLLLLSRGASTTKKNKEGETPLHYAAQFGSMDKERIWQGITALIVNGMCDPSRRNNEGLTPLGSAIYKPHRYRHDFWSADDRRGSFDTCLFRMVSLLRHEAAKVETDTKEGITALHQAASIGDVGSVMILLEYGVPVDIKQNGLMVLESVPTTPEVERVLVLNGYPRKTLDRDARKLESVYGSRKTRPQYLCSALTDIGLKETPMTLILEYSPHPVFRSDMTCAPELEPFQPHLYPMPGGEAVPQNETITSAFRRRSHFATISDSL